MNQANKCCQLEVGKWINNTELRIKKNKNFFVLTFENTKNMPIADQDEIYQSLPGVSQFRNL